MRGYRVDYQSNMKNLSVNSFSYYNKLLCQQLLFIEDTHERKSNLSRHF